MGFSAKQQQQQQQQQQQTLKKQYKNVNMNKQWTQFPNI